MTVVNETEVLSVQVQDVESAIVTVCCQDATLAVCCDAE